MLTGGEAVLADSAGWFGFERWFHRECRVFIEQDEDALLLNPSSPEHFRYRYRYRYRYRWLLTGLKNATVRCFPITGLKEHTQILLNPGIQYYTVSAEYDGGWVSHALGRFW